MPALPVTHGFHLEDDLTGQAGNITFRVTPYSADITGLTVAETASAGYYTVSGFGDTADAYYQDVKMYLSGVLQPSFGVRDLGDPSEEFLSISTTTEQDILSDIDMNSKKLKSLAAGTTNGDSVRYEQVGKLAVANSWSALNTFNTAADGSIPRINDPTVSGLPTSNLHIATKYYVDSVLGTATGIRQSTHLIQCLPTSSLSDTYSRPTMELCASYLTGIGISSTQGIATIDATGNAGCAIDLDDGTSQWIVAGMHIVGIGRPVLVRRAPNDSLTVAGYIHNCAITDSITGTRSYTNFTFYNCHFNFAANNLGATFTNCNFFGTCKIQFASGDTLVITGCTGDTLIVNDDADLTLAGATQPVNILTSASANLGI